MGFKYAEKAKGSESCVCPVCKRKVQSKDMMLMKFPYNVGVGEMCSKCFTLCYKNDNGNRNIAAVDDAFNLATQNRNADILENGSANGLTDEGLEYGYPGLTDSDVTDKAVGFVSMFVLLEVLTTIAVGILGSEDMEPGVLPMFTNGILMITAVLLFLRNIKHLVNGIHTGISIKRRRRIVLTTLIYFTLACVGLTKIIS